MYGDPPEPFSCATWCIEVVRRLSSWEVMGGEGPVLDCAGPRGWLEEILEWARDVSAHCSRAMGEVVIKESTKCRVWKSKVEGKKAQTKNTNKNT